MSITTTPDGLARYVAAELDVCERESCRLEIHVGDSAAWDAVQRQRICGECADAVAEERA